MPALPVNPMGRTAAPLMPMDLRQVRATTRANRVARAFNRQSRRASRK